MQQTATAKPADGGAAFTVLLALSFSHLLNDLIQSLIPAIYPLLKDSFDLNFTQIGLITLTFQVTNSGSKVTEFYLLGDDGLRIVGEVENIGAGTDNWQLGANFDMVRGNNGSVTQVGTLTLLGRI